MKEYHWNSYDVCLNADEIDVIKRKDGYYGIIEVGERCGRWFRGYNYGNLNLGSAAPCLDIDKSWCKGCRTREEAIEAAFIEVRAGLLKDCNYKGAFLPMPTEQQLTLL